MPVSGIFMEESMIGILKRRDFARWQAGEKLPDTLLCKAAAEMERGMMTPTSGAYFTRSALHVPGVVKVAVTAP